jgi:hypothetical protein
LENPPRSLSLVLEIEIARLRSRQNRIRTCRSQKRIESVIIKPHYSVVGGHEHIIYEVIAYSCTVYAEYLLHHYGTLRREGSSEDFIAISQESH